MSYNVSKSITDSYGEIIILSIEENGEFKNPFKAFNKIKLLKRLSKSKIMINDQILNIKQTEKWINEEYFSLPKCFSCGEILSACSSNDVFTHKLCGVNLFCSQKCADKDLSFQLDKLNDEEEIEL